MSNNRVLFIIVLAQFCCTSLWFASNGVIHQLMAAFDLPSTALGYLTSAVQFGFIAGTLIFALSNIADHFSPSKVFLACALLGAGFNALILLESNQLWTLLLWRFAVGFSLAGIYPIGMKIAADYFDKGLGKSLGLLVGALVLGTALPHLMNAYSLGFDWKMVLMVISSLSVLGGSLMLLLVPDGPYRKASTAIDFKMAFAVFKNKDFKKAALGYFGHIWELYTFWAFVPLFLDTYYANTSSLPQTLSFYTFLIIGIGALSCIITAYWSAFFSSLKIARFALFASGICCLLCPIFYGYTSSFVFLPFLLFWGMVVIADSPMLSTLVAQNAPAEHKGTALTIVTCIGFALTIISIQLFSFLLHFISVEMAMCLLFVGPLCGWLSLRD